mmetsp:Transcript_21291/g.60781  ORF Transcript_21291/g.60781 Transcript_21291/m.60781 type:complete len:81 (-) Transcript_21291:317-559(-)
MDVRRQCLVARAPIVHPTLPPPLEFLDKLPPQRLGRPRYCGSKVALSPVPYVTPSPDSHWGDDRQQAEAKQQTESDIVPC